MVRIAGPAVLVAAALLSAPQAGADPDILTPNCTGGQVPQAGECKAGPGGPGGGAVGDAPGANPGVPLGLDPETAPAL